MKMPRQIWFGILKWGLLWTAIIGISLLWNQYLVRKHIRFHAHNEASTVINKDHAFRRWATMHGGVYVHPTETTPPNPWLKVPKRDVVTTDGDPLTLMNPAYMTRQIMGMFGDLYGIKGHITSLHLKNPHNAPDNWEREALHRFEQGAPYVAEMSMAAGVPVYRLIQPMKMEQGCLKCHADTKIPVGGIRGGISTIVPLTSHMHEAAVGIRALRLGHGAIWLLGMFGITIASVRSHRQQLREWQTETALRAQEALYASLITASPIGVFQTDTDGRCCYVNDRWCAITGLPLEQALGTGWSKALHPDDRQRVLDAWQQSVQQQYHFSLEHRFKRPDGSVAWVLGQSASISDASGAVSGYVGTITDITALKLAEHRLADTLLFLNESQAIANVAGWKSNPRTNMLEWTDSMYRLLEHPAGEPLSHEACFRYFDPCDQPMVRQAIERALEDGKPFQLTCRMITRSGRNFWADFRCVGKIDAADDSYLAGVLQDISEFKKVEELLTVAKETAEATSRAKSALLATVSHELRTPLNGVLGGAQLLEMTELSTEQADYLAMITVSAASELTLVNDLLDMAGLEASGQLINEAPYSLLESITAAVQQHQTALESRGLTFTAELSDSLNQEVIGDGQRVTQIVSNLLGNAIKFTTQGKVTLSAMVTTAANGQQQLQLQVSDTGIGIDPRNLERIFEPFVQADMSHTRKFGGSGLGLAICRRLAERMGGRLRVESQPGEGSCFTLELPLRRAGSVVPAAAVDMPATVVWSGSPLKVLIAEDNEINLKATAGLLRVMGLQTTCAADGKQALAHWMGGAVDLILMDIQMPVMDGLEAVHFIRQRERGTGHHTPVIALTARAMAGERERLLAEGFDGYLAKPCSLGKLAEELSRVTADGTVGTT